MQNSTRIQLLIATVLIVGLLSGCTAGVYEAEIGSGIGSGWFQWIVEQVADFTVWISELAGGYYWVGLLVMTLFFSFITCVSLLLHSLLSYRNVLMSQIHFSIFC